MIVATTNPAASKPERLLALGRSSQSWVFLEQATKSNSSDVGVLLLVASHLAKLGLKTLASESIAALPDAIRHAPEIAALERGVASLPEDRVPNTAAAWTFQTNIRALGNRLNVASPIDAPCESAFYRASDGNVIARRRGHVDITDGKNAAARLVAEHRSTWAQSPSLSLIIAGLRGPWILKAASEARPRDPLGFRAPICVVEPDAEAFRDAMSMCDLTTELRDDHIRAFVGPTAIADFENYLRHRLDLRLSGSVATDPSAPLALLPEIEAVLAAAMHEQQTQTRTLELALHERLRDRDPDWWRARFASKDTPLRVLIPTTRYSTFVRYSSEDIAAAFRSFGHQAHILIEPDSSSTLSAASYLRALHDLDPDLVICINYPRRTIGDFLPRNIPWICWIQDQMPHLFDERIGKSQGELDLVIGHVDPSLHERYAYPRDSSMVLAVPASETKFFASQVTDSDRAKFECEIAYVSHQSETPDAQHERILAKLRSDPSVDAALIRAMPRLREAVQTHVALPLSTLPFPSMKQVVAQTLQETLGDKAPQQIVDRLVTGYAEPLADRIMRHETLQWAADAARRNGWRFNLYGKGWESHPTLAPFAKGPLAHDSDLRLSYQLAGSHLQVTYHMLAHPRLCECVLSGGIPLCRMHWGEMAMIVRRAYKQAHADGVRIPVEMLVAPTDRLSWTDAPSLMQLAINLQEIGCLHDAAPLSEDGARPGAMVEPWSITCPDTQLSSAFEVTGEQASLCFHDESTFEERTALILESPHLRQVRNSVARKRIVQRHTYRWAAQRILAFVNRRLESTDKAIPA
jgi:hypothetical protein